MKKFSKRLLSLLLALPRLFAADQADGTLEQVTATDDPWIRSYFEARRMLAEGSPDGA